MAESIRHLSLVRAILDYVSRKHRDIGYLALLHDLPGVIGTEKPPRVGGFVPDVYAVNVPCTLTIIGEAKTTVDLEAERSRKQMRAFIEFLARKERGIFVLAVPWQAVPRARGVVASVGRSLEMSSVECVFLDGITFQRATKC